MKLRGTSLRRPLIPPLVRDPGQAIPFVATLLFVTGFLPVLWLSYRLATLPYIADPTAAYAVDLHQELAQSRREFESYLYHGGTGAEQFHSTVVVLDARLADLYRAADTSADHAAATSLIDALGAYEAAATRVESLVARHHEEAAVTLWAGEGVSRYATTDARIRALSDREIARLAQTTALAHRLTIWLLVGFAYLATAGALCGGVIGHQMRGWQVAAPMVSLLTVVERAGRGDYASPTMATAPREFHELSQGIEWLRRTLLEQQQRLAERMHDLELSRREVEKVARELDGAYRQEAQWRQELGALVQTTTIISSQLQLDALLPLVVREAMTAFGAQHGCVLLARPGSDQLYLGIAHASTSAGAHGLTFSAGDIGLDEHLDAACPYYWMVSQALSLALLGPGVGATSVLVAPLAIGETRLGALVIAVSATRGSADRDVELAQTFAAHTAVAIENARLYALVDEERRLFTALAETSATLNSTQEIDHLLPLTLDRLAVMLDVQEETMAIARFDAVHQTFAVVAARGARAAELKLVELPVAELTRSQRSRLLHQRQPFWGEGTEDVPARLRAALGPDGAVDGIAPALVPLVWQSEVLGLLLLLPSRRVEISGPRLAVLRTFSYHAAIATKNAALLATERATIARLERSNQARLEFLSMVSHELRHPLAMLHNYASLLLKYRKQLTEQQHLDYLETIHRESGQVIHLVRDILDVSRIDAELLVYDMQACDLSELVLDACHEYQAVSALHPVVWEIVDSVVVLADPPRLRQVLGNLLDNAIKYSPEGGEVRVSVKIAPDRRHVVVDVSDQGVGLSPEEQQLLFRKFSRVRNDRTAAISGTGLGLYISASILEAHGGIYHVNSSPGGGTTIGFALPLADSRSIEEQAL